MKNTPPQALLDLIALQTDDLRPLLVPHWDKWTRCWTIALKANRKLLLRSEIAEVQIAEVRFNADLREDEDGQPTPAGAWEEGKPGLEESHTTYHVGPHELLVPEDFTDRIVRYH